MTSVTISILGRLRWWFIRKIVGTTTVILNADIERRNYEEATLEVVKGQIIWTANCFYGSVKVRPNFGIVKSPRTMMTPSARFIKWTNNHPILWWGPFVVLGVLMGILGP